LCPLIVLRFTKKSTSPIQNLLHLDSAWTMASDLTLSILPLFAVAQVREVLLVLVN
jgi:hypothetical protein